jgi:hypothetical protein
VVDTEFYVTRGLKPTYTPLTTPLMARWYSGIISCPAWYPGSVLGSAPGVGGYILQNSREVDITQGFCPEAGSPLCCRFISEEKFRDLLSPNGYISG